MKNESKEDSKYLPLIQQFNTLEKEWKSLQNPKPRNPRTSFISSDTNSTTNSTNSISTIITSFMYHSPRDLMHSLQESLSHRFWREKPPNTAVEEVLSDRRAAIVTGKLRGRRLFPAAADGGVYSCSDSSQDKKVVVVEKEMVAEKGGSGGDRRLRGGGGGIPVALVGFVLLVVFLCLIFVSCDGKCRRKNECINLVPT